MNDLLAIQDTAPLADRMRPRNLAAFLIMNAAACFGALGGTLGMALCRHKTKRWHFRYGFPALLAAILQWFFCML